MPFVLSLDFMPRPVARPATLGGLPTVVLGSSDTNFYLPGFGRRTELPTVEEQQDVYLTVRRNLMREQMNYRHWRDVAPMHNNLGVLQLLNDEWEGYETFSDSLAFFNFAATATACNQMWELAPSQDALTRPSLATEVERTSAVAYYNLAAGWLKNDELSSCDEYAAKAAYCLSCVPSDERDQDFDLIASAIEALQDRAGPHS